MTVIAANLSQMACDSMVSDGFVDFPSPKIRAHRGSIYGASGDCEGIVLFWEWLFSGRSLRRKPVSPDEAKDLPDFEVLELSPKGLFVWGRQFIPMPVARPVHAIGAGAQAAMAAMLCGKDPVEACEIACEVVPSSCVRPINTYDLVDAQKAVRRRSPLR